MGEGTRARGERFKGFGSGGVGGRGTGPRDGANFATIFDISNAYKKEEKWRFLKVPLWGGGRHKGSGRGVQGLRFWGGRW